MVAPACACPRRATPCPLVQPTTRQPPPCLAWHTGPTALPCPPPPVTPPQKFIRQPGIPVETAMRVYRRYLKLEPEHAEEYIVYLKAQVRGQRRGGEGPSPPMKA